MTALEGKRLSTDGARFIAGWEGCVLHPYNDAANNATIGIGHLIHLGPVDAGDLATWRGFTYQRAIELLQRDVGEVERAIRFAITVDLDQHEFDALVDLAFNCGPGVLQGTIGDLVNERRMQAAGNAMLAWDHAGGVVLAGLRRRREADRRLLLEPEAAYFPADERRWEAEYDALRGRKGLAAAGRRRALERAMTKRRRQIWQLAQQSGWAKLNRAQRYRELLSRTGG